MTAEEREEQHKDIDRILKMLSGFPHETQSCVFAWLGGVDDEATGAMLGMSVKSVRDRRYSAFRIIRESWDKQQIGEQPRKRGRGQHDPACVSRGKRSKIRE